MGSLYLAGESAVPGRSLCLARGVRGGWLELSGAADRGADVTDVTGGVPDKVVRTRSAVTVGAGVTCPGPPSRRCRTGQERRTVHPAARSPGARPAADGTARVKTDTRFLVPLCIRIVTFSYSPRIMDYRKYGKRHALAATALGLCVISG